MIPGCLAHPAFAPYARWWSGSASHSIPGRATLNDWSRDAGISLRHAKPLRFVAPPPAPVSALDYERRIAELAEVATRDANLHDFCNALVWLAFPRTRAALNAVHVESGACGRLPGASANRNRQRDAATLLDESGMLVACADPSLLEDWRAHAWRKAFGDRRRVLASGLRVAMIGHGTLAKCVAPFRAIAVRALVLPVDLTALPEAPLEFGAALDAAAARWIGEARESFTPESMLPLPIAALPGWDCERLGSALFDDTSVFRRPAPPRPRPRADGVVR